MAAGGFGTRQFNLENRDEEKDREWVKATVFVPGRKEHAPAPCRHSTLEHPMVDEECILCQIPSSVKGRFSDNAANMERICAAREKHLLAVSKKEECKCKEKECGICLERILETQNPDLSSLVNSFGILNNCEHAFCLPCIRTWRSNKDNNNYRKCPFCRISSEFVAPSIYWVNKEEKNDLMKRHIETLRQFKNLSMTLKYPFQQENEQGRMEREEPRRDGVHHLCNKLMYAMNKYMLNLNDVDTSQWLCVEDELDQIHIES